MAHGVNNYNYETPVASPADGATVTIDTLAGIIQKYSTTQDHTINFTGDGLLTTLVITCDASARTITWGTNVHSSSSSYVLTANKKRVITFKYDGGEHVLACTPVVIS